MLFAEEREEKSGPREIDRRMDLEENQNPAAAGGGPEYTELGIKVMGYKFTMKLQRRASSASAERARLAAAASETATEVNLQSCPFPPLSLHNFISLDLVVIIFMPLLN